MLNAREIRAGIALLMALLIAGCAGIPPDRGADAVRAWVEARGRPAPSLEGIPDAPLTLSPDAPLTVEEAVRLALSRNPELLERYAALGIAQAEIYAAARLSNPVFSLAWLDSTGRSAQVSLGLAQNFVDLLQLVPRKRLAEQALTRTQQEGAARILALASKVEVAYWTVVGAQAEVSLRRRAARAADTAAALAARLHAAGNLSRLALAREQAAASTARIATYQARSTLAAARATLNIRMGLGAEEDRWRIKVALPVPTHGTPPLPTLVTAARLGRLDVLAARVEVARAEQALGLTRSWRWLPDGSVSVTRQKEADGSVLTGPGIALPLPLFNWGEGRILEKRAALDAARARLRARENAMRHALTSARAGVENARRAVDEYRQGWLPRQEEVLEELAKRHAFMLVGQFDVIAARRALIEASSGYYAALTRHAVARAALAGVIGARLPDDPSSTGEILSRPSPPAPPGASP